VTGNLLTKDSINLLDIYLKDLGNNPNDLEVLNQVFELLINNEVRIEDIPEIINHKGDIRKLDVIFNNLGTLFWENKSYEFVIPLFNEALRENPKNMDALYNIGYTLFQYGEYELAQKYLKLIETKSQEVFDLIQEIEKKITPQFFKEYNIQLVKLPEVNKDICVRINTTDPVVFQQIFQHREYELPSLSFTPKFIIDGGANVGYASIFFANTYPNAKIVAIEPERTNFEVLKYNTKSYEQVEIIKSGLWHKNTHLKVKDIGLGKWGAIVEETDSLDPDGFRAITISSILESSKMDEIDILKLDIEGAEKELFLYEYQGWLEKVKVIIIELHDRMKKGCSNSFFRAISNYNFVSFVKGEHIILMKEELYY
jgi:FkbM family methyltransferase